MIRGLLFALGFLTRVPVPARIFADARAQRWSLVWYPLVGALVGAALVVTHALLPTSKPLLSAALLLALWVWLTGGLHLDGLADSADAWVGGMGDRQRTLDIMKDPRSGPAGVTAIALLLLLRFAALASLDPRALPALWIAPMLARAALVAAFSTTPYVRSGGMGRALTDTSRWACATSLALTLAACAACGRGGLLAVCVAGVVFALWRRGCRKRLGGFTGDTAGALAELTEAAVLVSLAWG